MRFRTTTAAVCTARVSTTATDIRAEVSEITVAQQYGVSFLPLMVMEKQTLIEKHAKQLGLGNIKVTWTKVAGPSVMNDGLISNTIHFADKVARELIAIWYS